MADIVYKPPLGRVRSFTQILFKLDIELNINTK